MAKKTGKRAGKRTAKKTGKKGGRAATSASAAKKRALRQANGVKRAKLHAAAALLKDFHGGKGPIKSGCGRPRGT
jgi:hypothetical protein